MTQPPTVRDVAERYPVLTAAGTGGCWGGALGCLLAGHWAPAALGGALCVGTIVTMTLRESRRLAELPQDPDDEELTMQAVLMYWGEGELHRGRTYRVEVRQRRGQPPVVLRPTRRTYASWEDFWRDWRPAGRARTPGPWVPGTLDGEPWRCAARQRDSGARCQLPRPHTGHGHDQPLRRA